MIFGRVETESSSEFIVLCDGARSGRITIGEKHDVAAEGGVRLSGTSGGIARSGGTVSVGRRRRTRGSENERSDHGETRGEMERKQLTFVKELIGRTERGGSLTRRNRDGEFEIRG